MNAADAVSRIPYRLAAAAIICLCDQNPELITPRATARSLFGLAAGGVYHAAELSLPPGGLLPHPFTLTGENSGGLLSVALVLPQNMVCGTPLFKGAPRSVQSGLSSTPAMKSGAAIARVHSVPFNNIATRQ